jgi:probable HAF family extracellular repeat protein
MTNHSLVAVLSFILSSASFADVRYKITELPAPPGATGVEATGTNDHGQVAGFARYPGGRLQPLTWEAGMPKLIAGSEEWYSGYAGPINAQGHVAVGWWDGQSRRSLVLASVGGEHLLRPPSPQTSGRIFGLNDHDHAVGFTNGESPGMARAVLWRDRSMINLGVSGGPGTTAYDIDNADRIVGVRVAGPVGQPFRWHHGLLSWLQLLHPGRHAAAVALNNLGHAVGGAIGADGDHRAVLWMDTSAVDLGTLPGGQFSNATDINDVGQIVGAASDDGGGGAAVLWQDEQILNLNGLVVPGSPWQLSAAVGINNGGQIIGSGAFDGRPAVFLLTPVPGPGLGLGMALLLLAAYRRTRP